MRAIVRVVVVGAVLAGLLAPGAPAAAGVAPCSKGDVALTFDDGPRPPHTTSILDILKAKRAPGTFFVVGRAAAARPALIARMHADGHQVGNHSWSHPRLSGLSASGIRRELTLTNDELRRQGLPRPIVMRPPYGATNRTVRAVASDLGLAHVLWSIDTNDWRSGRTPSQIRRSVLDNLHAGANILMHDGVANSGATAAALPGMIDGIRARGYCIGTLSATGAVVPTVPRLRVGSARAIEGPAGTTATLSFPVTLSVPTSRRVTVAFHTADGTAAAGADYTARSGTISIPPGATSGTIRVRVLGDDLHEHDETVKLTLSSAGGATIARATATGTIVDDDAPPSLRVLNARAAETAGSVKVTVELDRISGRRITARTATEEQTAAAGVDFLASTSTLIFQPGVRTRTLTVPLVDRPDEQGQRTFLVIASGVTDATVARRRGTVTITDVARPSVSASSIDVSESAAGREARVKVELSAPTPRPVTVAYATGRPGDTALADIDYRSTSGMLSFAPGERAKEVAITILPGGAERGDRAFTVALATPVNAVLASPSAATVMIRGAEPAP